LSKAATLTATTGTCYGSQRVAQITTAEAAVILKITPVRVRQLIQSTQLKSEKKGRDHLLFLEEVERFAREGRRPWGRPRKFGAKKIARAIGFA
jgi:hypothetical protein